MPRFSTVAPSGCRPARVISGDELGYVKVIESRGQNAGQPEVVARWGDGGRGKGVDRMQVTSSGPFGGLVTVARSDQTIDLLDIASGQLRASWLQAPATKAESQMPNPYNSKDPVKGVHLFQTPLEGAAQLLTCSSGGAASLRKVNFQEGGGPAEGSSTVAEWGVGAGVESLAVEGKEQTFAVGGKVLDATLWSLETKAKLWQAKNTRPDALGLQTPTWVTQLLFLGGNGNKLLAGTGHHQLRLYDIKAQRRPVMVMDFGELPIWSVAEDPAGHVVYAGNGGGDLASFDLRTGTKSGGFLGSISGSVRSLSVHPTEPLLASVGLDRFLRIYSTQSRKLLAKVFLKQQMVACAFDTDPSREPEEAEPPAEEEKSEDEPAANLGRPMEEEEQMEPSGSESGESDDDDSESEQDEAPSRKRGLKERGKRGGETKRRKRGGELSSDDEERGRDSDDEDDNRRKKTGAKEEKRKGEERRKRKKGLASDDDDSEGEGFGGDGDWGDESDEESEGARKGSKGKGKRQPAGEKKGALHRKGSARLENKVTPKGKKKRSRQRT